MGKVNGWFEDEYRCDSFDASESQVGEIDVLLNDDMINVCCE